MRHKKKVQMVLLSVLVLLAAACVVVVQYFRGNFTTYSDGYSEKKFQQIKVGDEVATVTELLGEPLEKTPYGRCIVIEDKCVQFCMDREGRVQFVLDPYGVFKDQELPMGIKALSPLLNVAEDDIVPCQMELWRYSLFKPHEVHKIRALRIDLCTRTVSHKFSNLWFP